MALKKIYGLSKAEESNALPQVLFISYYFPPTENIAGSVRSESFAKNLPSFGWSVSVLALKENIGEETYSNVTRVRSLTPKSQNFHLDPYGWVGPLVTKVLQLLRREKYKAIYATLPPFPTAIALLTLSRLKKTPLVIDLRDAWTLGPYQKENLIEKIFHKWLYPWLERSLIQTASALIVNTPSALVAYKNIYPDFGSKIHYIPNGFDETDFADAPQPTIQDGFVLLHCGSFGVSGRHPEPILLALKAIITSGHDIELRVIGQTNDDLVNYAIHHGVRHHIKIIPPVSHRAAIEHQMNCDALLLYQAHSVTEVTAIAGKTFEYIRTGRPILAVTPEGDNRDLVKSFAGFFELGDSSDINSIINALEKLITAKKKGFLPVKSPTNEEFQKKYERREITQSLVTVLNSIIT